MSREFFSPRIQNYLTWQVRQHSQKTGSSPVQPGPFITISREYGCQGRPLANLLAERLNEISPDPTLWVAMEKEVIEKIAQKEGEVATFVNALSDSRRSYIQQTADILIGQKPTEYQAYETLAESLMSLAHAGHVILLGRGGAVVCREVERGFHIRLVAPLPWRADKIAHERKISILEAESIASREEKRRESFVRDFTGIDTADPHNYDLVINNKETSVETIANITILAMKQKGVI